MRHWLTNARAVRVVRELDGRVMGRIWGWDPPSLGIYHLLVQISWLNNNPTALMNRVTRVIDGMIPSSLLALIQGVLGYDGMG